MIMKKLQQPVIAVPAGYWKEPGGLREAWLGLHELTVGFFTLFSSKMGKGGTGWSRALVTGGLPVLVLSVFPQICTDPYEGYSVA